ncbi:MAG: ATP-binding protein [Selenomonadaceae bacterium]|nr:ATP-binding protein [Selenomonadaceae bacterium]
MTYISRAIEKTFLAAVRDFKVVLVTGPRQCGKTTMMKKMAEDENRGRKYISLDDFATRKMAVESPNLFLQVYKPPVFIDEVQYAPQLFSYIKMYVDEYQQPGDIWLSGSQIFKLMENVQESLAGRVGILKMNTFSQAEIEEVESSPFRPEIDYLIARGENRKKIEMPELYERIFKGSLPDVVQHELSSRDRLYSSYIATYIERDVREISGIIDSLKFYDFVTATAAHIGQIINFRTIANAAGISVQTAKEWMQILERLGIIFFLHPYTNNLLKRTISKPKLYFYDTGLAIYLTRWSDSITLMNGSFNVAALENFVVSEIVKSYYNAGEEHYINYYRDKDAKEIDIVREINNTVYPMEIKKTGLPDARITKVFSVLENKGKTVAPGIVLCTAQNISTLGKGNYVVPIAFV